VLPQYQQKLADNFTQMRQMLLGDSESEPKRENIDKLCDSLMEGDLFLSLIDNFPIFEFESRKDIAQVMNFIIRNRRDEIVSFVQCYPVTIDKLMACYQHSDLALAAGAILREILRYPELCTLMLTPTTVDKLFALVQVSVFDVASDAFATLKALLGKHKKLVAKYLETHFEDFFGKYMKLLSSDNYVTKRLALKLLAELLLCRDNFAVMMKFINITDHLKAVMALLKGSTKAIQIEAFHVFKIFVANPRKADAIKVLLYRNRTKLIDFLTKFQKDKPDEQLNDEKNILLHTLSTMEPPAGFEGDQQAAPQQPQQAPIEQPQPQPPVAQPQENLPHP
jgi:calcium binding protein 39